MYPVVWREAKQYKVKATRLYKTNRRVDERETIEKDRFSATQLHHDLGHRASSRYPTELPLSPAGSNDE